MPAVPSGYTSHQGNPVSRPELHPFRSSISSRRYVTSATAPLTYVTAAVAVKIFDTFQSCFCLVVPLLFRTVIYIFLITFLRFFVCYIFAFYFGLASFLS